MSSNKSLREKYWSPTGDAVDLTKEERESLTSKIKRQLTEYRLTQVWLITQLGFNGLSVDKFEMSSVLSGVRLGPKVDEILRQSEKILEIYADRMDIGKRS